MKLDTIRLVDLTELPFSHYSFRGVEAVVLTQDNKIILQQRGNDWQRFPGYLSNFGGQIEAGENPTQALIRELNEELGAKVLVTDVVFLSAITEAQTNHAELVYVYFWHDKKGTITGCYEGEIKYFADVKTALNQPKVMESARWSLQVCQNKGLF